MEKAWRSVQRIHSGTGKQGLFLKKYNIFYPFEKKDLQTFIFSYILAIAVALIAVKREVAAHVAGFPWSECQVRKLTTSHCTNVKCLSER